MERETNQCEAALQPLRAKKDEAAKRVKEKHAPEYRRVSEEAKKEEQSVAPATAAIEAECRKALARRKARFESDLADAETARRPALAEAEAKLAQARGQRRGGMQILKRDLPLCLAAVAAGSATAYALDFKSLFPNALAGSPGIALGAGVGLGIGLLASWIVRNRPVWRLSRAAGGIRRELEAEKKRLTTQYEAETAKLKEGAKGKVAKIKARLNALQEEKQKIAAKAKAESEAEAEKIDAEMKKIQQRTDKAIKALEAKLLSACKPKAESARAEFPAYRKAKSSQYKDGERPSETEAQSLMSAEFAKFRSSLESWEAAVLQKVIGTLGSAQSAEFLGSLMAMSRQERQRKLRELMGAVLR
jgi:hypothetical protein